MLGELGDSDGGERSPTLTALETQQHIPGALSGELRGPASSVPHMDARAKRGQQPGLGRRERVEQRFLGLGSQAGTTTEGGDQEEEGRENSNSNFIRKKFPHTS